MNDVDHFAQFYVVVYEGWGQAADVATGEMLTFPQTRLSLEPRNGHRSFEMSLLTIAPSEAAKLCARLEFDASWDKAGDGYYQLKRQLREMEYAPDTQPVSLDLLSARREFQEGVVDFLEAAEGKPVGVDAFRVIASQAIRHRVEAIKSVSDAAIVLARNPEILNSSVSTGDEGESLLRLVISEFGSYLAEDLHELCIQAFVDQFDERFDPLKNYREFGEKVIARWLRLEKKDKDAGQRAEMLREGLKNLQKSNEAVVYYVDALATGKRLQKEFAAEAKIAREALELLSAFRARRRAAKASRDRS